MPRITYTPKRFSAATYAVIDHTLWDECVEREESQRQVLDAASSRWQEVTEYLR